MSEVHDLRLARKRLSLPIPESAKALVVFGIGLPATAWGVTFRLRRVKEGTEIFLLAGGFSWNLSVLENVWPDNFAVARRWIAAYGSRYGQVIGEAPPCRPRSPRPSGKDRAILKSGGCCEAWLSSDCPPLWAEAMIRCRHAAGFCGKDGYCHSGACDMEMLPEVVREDVPTCTPDPAPDDKP